MRLLVMSCSARKTIDPGLVPAIERYNGPLYQTYRKWEKGAPISTRPAILILSAEYGLIPARGLIPFYDRKMDRERASELIARGCSSADYTRLMQEAAGEQAPAFSNICYVGGKLYLDVMDRLLAPILSKNQSVDVVPPDRINGQIGYMRRDLRQWLGS